MIPGERRLVALAAAATWFALALQLYLVLWSRWQIEASLLGGLVHFFSFFTILTNTAVAGVLTAHVSTCNSKWRRICLRPAVSSGVMVSIVVVGVAYSLLLRNLWQPQGWQWLANELLHDVLPVAFVLYWALCVPKGTLRLWHVPAWAIYPLVYFAYLLLRGQSIGVYPYPFLDVSKLGMGQVWLNALGVLMAFLGCSVLVLAVDRWWGRRGTR
ncbi:Pr6Pr family membrane protein [Pseudomonas sp. CFBP 13710]|uniref:Pr6Pr family membrane protein n=1 Tax=Pseudomonas sp. CFBP 13710 TaxID=2775311 RepID=UPI001785554E|nr:Pr6Pr family membrane protein [Pseudomonas sp. CFBP 13710]MBD8733631.1 Pr6Pr family membrane protein [Pseudomonas sp. CFBP 13710]